MWLDRNTGTSTTRQAAVAVGLGLTDVIHLLHQLDVLLAGDEVGQTIDVVDVIADDAHAGDVLKVLLGGLHRQRQALALQLGQNAPRRFQAAVDMMNRVARIENAELPVENFQPGSNFADGRVVEMRHLEKALLNRRVAGQLQQSGFFVHGETPFYKIE